MMRIRTVLRRTPVRGRSPSARRGDAERHLTRIASEADRLEQLIARTLQLVCPEHPVGTLDREQVNVGDRLRTMAADILRCARSCVGTWRQPISVHVAELRRVATKARTTSHEC
jgi:hypothetical protein